MSKLDDYLETLEGFGSWSPASTPATAPAVGGFQLVGKAAGQLSRLEFFADSLEAVWTPLGVTRDMAEEAAGTLADTMQELISSDAFDRWSEALQIAETAGEAIGQVVAYYKVMWALANQMLKLVPKTIIGNQEKLRAARLGLVDELEVLGPNFWAGGVSQVGYYKRKIGVTNTVTPLCWTPVRPGYGNPLMYPDEVGVPIQGDGMCKCAELECRRHSKGSIMLFPLYMPVWSSLAIGGARQSMRAGMLNTSDGGAAIWDGMLAMQTALLTDPVVNLQLDAGKVVRRLKFVRQKMATYIADSGFPIDASYDGAKKSGHYWRPDGQIGEYSATGPRLPQAGGVVIRKNQPNCYGAEQNFPLSEFNAIVSASCAFLAFRQAIMRDENLLADMRARAPELLEYSVTQKPGPDGGIVADYTIPEKEVRVLLETATASAKPVGSKLIGSIATGLPPKLPPFMPVAVPEPEEGASAAGVVGVVLAIILGLLLV